MSPSHQSQPLVLLLGRAAGAQMCRALGASAVSSHGVFEDEHPDNLNPRRAAALLKVV